MKKEIQMNIYAVKNPSYIEEDIYNLLISFISEEKKRRLKRFVKKEDVYRSLLGDVLIRSVICKKYELSNTNIEFENNEYGKPNLKGFNNLFFNISHSEDWIVCVVDGKAVGIDIEKVGSIEYENIIQFFSDEEQKVLNSKEPTEKEEYFYDLWTLKESYVKAIGKGLSIPLDSFGIIKTGKNIKVETNNMNFKCFFRQYELDANYKLSVCAESNHFPTKIKIKNLTDITQDILE
ncbi:4'-phosphopantetheinyl transferase superfamily protein [Bacillus cereus]|uniref:4'-phosphopantetheinyl transferase superfamily protein n=2 Tax=Bacillus TaxID=1386 RepID=A0A9W7QFF8_BACCE|nr:4'-phosphopantetheinyl transferase superfamily protein [Bacillus cereus]KAB2408140.1 4'-phosphopantetheinyl transferase superfamily protein [Bacillus cereus]KAB2428835.1 4'-phosphopantetheinyl transferase superfamily protein [Bacillus cereus]